MVVLEKILYDKKYRLILFCVCYITALFILPTAIELLSPLIVGYFMAYLFSRVRIKGVGRKLTSVIMTVLFVAILMTIITAFLYFIYKFAVYAVDELPVIKIEIERFMELVKQKAELKFTDEIIDRIKEGVLNFQGEVYKSLLSFLERSTDRIKNILMFLTTTLFCTYFISVDYDRISKRLFRSEIGKKVKNSVKKTFKGYIKTQLMIMCAVFFTSCCTLYIIDVSAPHLIAVLIAAVDALPVIGSGIVLIPWAVFSLVKGNMLRALELVLLVAVINILRNIIESKLTGNETHTNPCLSLVSVYAGYRLMGVVGLVVFPIATTFALHLYRNLDT